ncbi:MAG: hypothetical protein HDR45_06245 [Bacteroides sp.]|nr:hypothetical protein [Bacteroides sp.]
MEKFNLNIHESLSREEMEKDFALYDHNNYDSDDSGNSGDSGSGGSGDGDSGGSGDGDSGGSGDGGSGGSGDGGSGDSDNKDLCGDGLPKWDCTGTSKLSAKEKVCCNKCPNDPCEITYVNSNGYPVVSRGRCVRNYAATGMHCSDTVK